MRTFRIATGLCGLLIVGCAQEQTGTQAAGETTGALVHMEMSSSVAVLLDEIPVGPQREAAAAEALAQNTKFWTDRAARQVRLTYYKLVFRGQYYSADWANSKN